MSLPALRQEALGFVSATRQPSWRHGFSTGAAAGRWRRMRTAHVTLGTEPHRMRDELPLERPTYIHGGGRDGGWYDLR